MQQLTSNSSGNNGGSNDSEAQLEHRENGGRDGGGDGHRARTKTGKHVVLDGETQQLVIPGIVGPDQREGDDHPDEGDERSHQNDRLQQRMGLDVVQVH